MVAADAGRLWQKLLVFGFCLMGGLKSACSRSEAHAGFAAGAEPEMVQVKSIDEQARKATSIGTHVPRVSRGPMRSGQNLVAVTRNR